MAMAETRLEREQTERDRNPAVFIAGVQCWCGAKQMFDGFWMWSQDTVEILCDVGHKSILRFVPDTIGRGV